MRQAIATAFVTTTALVTACAPDPGGTPIDAGVGDAGADSGLPTPSCTAQSAPVPRDPSTLPTCCSTGAAHCEGSSNVDPLFATHLAPCTGGVCVPDPFITNPSYVPKSCKSVGDAAGVCVSSCIPEVAKYGTILPVDVCDAGDRCAPCVSPLDGSSTGSCDLGKPSAAPSCGGAMTPDAGSGDARAPIAACPYTGPPLIDLSTLAACGTVAGAHCLSAKLVPATEVALLATCVGGYCVPDTFIVSGGNFSPATCRAAGDIEGRCLHEALPDVARQESSLAQSTCTAEERCVPCFDPLSAKDTGACHLGCDIGPHEPATLYASCCQGPHSTVPRGTCIPSEIIPASEQTNLAVDSCLAGKALCVPDEQLNHVAPVTCAATPSLGKPFQGVCLSACLTFDFISSLGMAQGTCDDLHVCVPCTNPITNQPTGAPGCPP